MLLKYSFFGYILGLIIGLLFWCIKALGASNTFLGLSLIAIWVLVIVLDYKFISKEIKFNSYYKGQSKESKHRSFRTTWAGCGMVLGSTTVFIIWSLLNT